MAIIDGGFIFLAKKILESDIWRDKPAWWLKVWLYLLIKVNYADDKPHRKFKRGQGFFRAEDIKNECSLHDIEVKTIHNLIKWLKSTTQITTQKTTRGMVITICNYEKYQDLDVYTNDTENDTENEKEKKQKRHDKEQVIDNTSDTATKGNKGNKGNKTLSQFLDFVFMSTEDHEKLINEMGRENTDYYVHRLNDYLRSNPEKYYPDHYAKIIEWYHQDQKKQGKSKHHTKAKQTPPNQNGEDMVDLKKKYFSWLANKIPLSDEQILNHQSRYGEELREEYNPDGHPTYLKELIFKFGMLIRLGMIKELGLPDFEEWRKENK